MPPSWASWKHSSHRHIPNLLSIQICGVMTVKLLGKHKLEYLHPFQGDCFLPLSAFDLNFWVWCTIPIGAAISKYPTFWFGGLKTDGHVNPKGRYLSVGFFWIINCPKLLRVRCLWVCFLRSAKDLVYARWHAHSAGGSVGASSCLANALP